MKKVVHITLYHREEIVCKDVSVLEINEDEVGVVILFPTSIAISRMELKILKEGKEL